jgi:glycine/D-amino acid oxidase-like deaminating enzyme
MVSQVAALLGIDLPVFSERHLKVSLRDHLGVIPREAPLVIWDDPQILAWSDEERAALAESDDTARLLGVLPSGVHARPEGGGDSQNILILWPYDAQPAPVVFPVPGDPLLPEVALRGMAALIPGLRAYFDQIPRPFVDGGYYTKTAENRLLSCPLPVDGAYLIGALSGFGLMASLGAGELLAAAITGAARPAYAPAFHLDRYRDPAYLKRLEDWGATGQL